jgi:hypothetical protein
MEYEISSKLFPRFKKETMGQKDIWAGRIPALRSIYALRTKFVYRQITSHIFFTPDQFQFHTHSCLYCFVLFSLNSCNISTELYINLVYYRCRKGYTFGSRSVQKFMTIYSENLNGIDCLEYPCVRGRIIFECILK